MIGRPPRSVAPLAWRGLLVAAAGLALAVELALPWEQAPRVEPAAYAAPGEPLRPAPPSPGAFAAIAQHPLFQPSRSPWAAPPPPPPSFSVAHAPPAPADFILAGVVISDTARSAIVRAGNAPETLMISEGETLNGWTLRRIDAAGLHFEAGNQAFDLGFPNVRQSGR